MGLRLTAISVLVAGIAAGTLTDRLPHRQTTRAREWVLLSGDFHVHAFPGDGALAPWTLRDEAARAGLDVLAVTNHNQVFTARLARWVASRSDGPMTLSGAEITNPRYHLIAVGIERPVNADQPAAMAIAAHPTPRFTGYSDDATIAQLDGTEAAHPVERPTDAEDFARFFGRVHRLKATIAPIGSSDFHVSPALGLCRTFIFSRDRSAAGVLEAIRSGRTVAMDEHGALTGDSNLLQLLKTTAIVGRSDPHPAWRRLSLTLAWIGLLGVLLVS